MKGGGKGARLRILTRLTRVRRKLSAVTFATSTNAHLRYRFTSDLAWPSYLCRLTLPLFRRKKQTRRICRAVVRSTLRSSSFTGFRCILEPTGER